MYLRPTACNWYAADPVGVYLSPASMYLPRISPNIDANKQCVHIKLLIPYVVVLRVTVHETSIFPTVRYFQLGLVVHSNLYHMGFKSPSGMYMYIRTLIFKLRSALARAGYVYSTRKGVESV